MKRIDDLKRRLKEGAESTLLDHDAVAPAIAKAAGDVVILAAEGVRAAESVAKRAGLTKRNGDFAPVKLVRKAAINPSGTSRAILTAAAEEIQSRRGTDGESR